MQIFTCSCFRKNADFIVWLHAESPQPAPEVVRAGVCVLIIDPPDQHLKKVVKDLKTKLFLSVKRFDIRDTSNHTPNTISIREGPGGEGYHFTPHYLCLTADVSHDV